MSLIYLASPYTDESEEVMHDRAQLVATKAGHLMADGNVVFSPIAHGHFIVSQIGVSLPQDFDFWIKQDLSILIHCDVLMVFTLEGWEESRGVQEEIAFANDNGIPVVYI